MYWFTLSNLECCFVRHSCSKKLTLRWAHTMYNVCCHCHYITSAINDANTKEEVRLNAPFTQLFWMLKRNKLSIWMQIVDRFFSFWFYFSFLTFKTLTFDLVSLTNKNHPKMYHNTRASFQMLLHVIVHKCHFVRCSVRYVFAVIIVYLQAQGTRHNSLQW